MLVKYYEQKNDEGIRVVCKETESTTWHKEQEDIIYVSDDKVRHNPTIATTVEYY